MKTFFNLREETTQVTVGDYTTKHFDMCPSAVKLYSNIKNMTPMVHLIVENMMLQDLFFRLEKQAVAQGAIDADDLEKADHYAEMIMDNAEQMGLEEEHSYIEDVHMPRFEQLAGMDSEEEDDGEDMNEKTLTPAEMRKREEIAKAIKRENPNMPMAKKMAIATATAKKVAEATQDISYMGGQALSRIANTVGHPQSAAAKNELARRMQKEAAFDNDSKAHDRHYEKQTPAVQTALDRYTRQGMSYKQAHAKISNPAGGHVLRKEITPLHEGHIKEAADMSKLKVLAHAGLVDSKDVERLMAAFNTMQAGKPLTQQQKDLILSSYSELASIVTGDSQTFQKAKKAVAEAVKK